MNSLPKVLIVGGPDVDARLTLMNYLRDDFEIGAVGSQPTLKDKFIAKGFNYHTYHLSRRVDPLSDLVTLSQLWLLFERLKPQIVHTFDTKPGIWGCLAAKLAGVPIVIFTLTGMGSLYINKSLKIRIIRAIYEPLQKLICSIGDHTVFQNYDDLQQFIKMGIVTQPKTDVILGSGVATDLFAPNRVSEVERSRVRSELGIEANELVVTMVARVIRSKGVIEFMAAAQALRRQHSNLRFLLIGSPDNDNPDRLNADELDRLKQVLIWPGSRQDIPIILSLSDLFVLPSAYPEGIPRVLLEAASMGLPLITTNSPGCNEVVEDGINGFLVPVGDAAALTQAIEHLSEHPELRQRFGQVSRQRAIDRFDISVVVAQTCLIYRQLLAQEGRRQMAEC